RCLEADPAVRSVAQLGSRLHALVDASVADPAGRLRARLQDAAIEASLELSEPNLEDVFVEATRRERPGERAA
ncbi:MAG: ABC transporter ATP-binding protein, partial [Thermoanaerobaculia bacterium]|nr:ABC transporter ATP-binding protein [Thermoanaerobaculia bacterium]